MYFTIGGVSLVQLCALKAELIQDKNLDFVLGEIHPRTGHEGPEGGKVIALLFL